MKIKLLSKARTQNFGEESFNSNIEIVIRGQGWLKNKKARKQIHS